MKLGVPYFSQQRDVEREEWRSRACGVTAIKMTLDFYAPKNAVAIDDLIDEGVVIGGYGEHGWIHDGLVILARNHGLNAYRQEFKSMTIDPSKRTGRVNEREHELAESGIKKITRVLESGMPVIVSIHGGFKSGGGHHIVVLTGVNAGKEEETVNGFYYHEPNSNDSASGMYAYVDRETFKKHWRKMAIFVSDTGQMDECYRA